MSTKKTIQINPELFKVTGNKNKTRKNNDKNKISLTPIVTPNNIKNKLLKRIKEHKTQELSNPKIPKLVSSSPKENNYTDEFYGALDYLSDLTKKQKTQKTANEARQKFLNTKTLKNHTEPNISVDLPPELQEQLRTPVLPQSNEVFNINYKVQDDVPYGCLKGGKKKTYREWKEINRPEPVDIPDIVRPPTPPKKNVGMFLEGATAIDTKNIISQQSLSREERLEQIKNKLKKIQDQETNKIQQSLDDFKTLEQEFINPIGAELGDLPDLDKIDHKAGNSEIEKLIRERDEKKESDKVKKYLKKTVKRKFTLGKSDKLRRVSVLIKDKQTRKNVINTQKELKKTNITDVRKYLRQHGILKVGSTCPADILRKTFESAVLTGEVTNTNKETLLHNFLSAETE